MPYKDPKKARDCMIKYRQQHKVEASMYAKKYFKNHEKKLKKYKKVWNQNHKEEVKKYYLEHRDILNEKKRIYHQINKEKEKIQRKEYIKIHKNDINKKSRDRFDRDIQFKLKKISRSRLYSALKKNLKSGSAIGDLGCSVSELKIHLENLFKPGMTWKNWTHCGWHIDHKIPISSFDLTNREHLLKAVHYTNLQPMWGTENMKKSDKLYYEK